MNTNIERILTDFGCEEEPRNFNEIPFNLNGERIACFYDNLSFALDVFVPRSLYSKVFDELGTPDFIESGNYHWVL